MKNRLVIVIGTLMLFGCASTSKERFEVLDVKLDTWSGESADDLYHVYGPPAAEKKLSDGTEMVSYSQNDITTSEKFGTYSLSGLVTFTIKNDQVTYWSYNGNLAPLEDIVKPSPNISAEKQEQIDDLNKRIDSIHKMDAVILGSLLASAIIAPIVAIIVVVSQ